MPDKTPWWHTAVTCLP